jgi:trimeric autotransporter adhesin
MSTKTTFKRVALVAVAALGFGLLAAVAPANAAPNTNLSCSVSYDAPTSTNISSTTATSNGVAHTYTVASHSFVVGQYVTISGAAAGDLTNGLVSAITTTSITVTPVSPNVAAAAGNVTVTLGAIVLGTENKTCKGLVGPANTVTISSTQATVKEYVVVSGGTFTDGTTSKTLGTGAAVSSAGILTPTAGNITVTGYAETAAGSGIYSATATDTLTIVVLSAPVGSVYASTRVVATTDVSNATARTVVSIDAVKSYYSAATTSLAAASFNYVVTQRDAAGATLSGNVTKAVAASVTGVGTLSIGDGVTTAQGGYVAQAAGSSTTAQDATATVRLYADGRAGTSTVTITVDGVSVATYTVIFYGSAASYSVTTNANYIAVGANAAVFTVAALDSNGVKVPGRTILATSSSTATATVAPTITSAAWTCADVNACTPTEFSDMGKANFAVTGVVAGEVTVTFANSATTATITATGKTNVSSGQIAALTWAFDKTSYTPGEAAAIKFTAKTSTGTPVADGTYTIFKANPTATKSAPGYAPAVTVDIVDGIGEWDFYAPTDSGDFKISATLGSGAGLASALRGAEVSITTSVTGGGAESTAQAATDAAAEATDAANAATDAANAAAEAADAATAAAQDAADAVAALSTQVSEMVDALKKQITALTNLVIKIQKKVKA